MILSSKLYSAARALKSKLAQIYPSDRATGQCEAIDFCWYGLTGTMVAATVMNPLAKMVPSKKRPKASSR